MAWFSPKPLLIPDILSLNSRFLRDKPAVIIDDATVSWTEFGNGTARVANALLDSGQGSQRIHIARKITHEHRHQQQYRQYRQQQHTEH